MVLWKAFLTFIIYDFGQSLGQASLFDCLCDDGKTIGYVKNLACYTADDTLCKAPAGAEQLAKYYQGAWTSPKPLELHPEDTTQSPGGATDPIGFIESMWINGHHCIDVPDGVPGSPHLVVNNCEFDQAPVDTDQRWQLRSDGFIENMKYRGKCIDVEGNPSTWQGAKILLHPCEFGWAVTDQQWYMRADGFVENRFNPGFCLDLAGARQTQTNKGLHLWPCSDRRYHYHDEDQTWKLTEGSPPPPTTTTRKAETMAPTTTPFIPQPTPETTPTLTLPPNHAPNCFEEQAEPPDCKCRDPIKDSVITSDDGSVEEEACRIQADGHCGVTGPDGKVWGSCYASCCADTIILTTTQTTSITLSVCGPMGCPEPTPEPSLALEPTLVPTIAPAVATTSTRVTTTQTTSMTISVCGPMGCSPAPEPTSPTEPTPTPKPSSSIEPTPAPEPRPPTEHTLPTEPTPAPEPTPIVPTPPTEPTPGPETSPAPEPTPPTEPTLPIEPTPALEPTPIVPTPPTEHTPGPEPTPTPEPPDEIVVLDGPKFLNFWVEIENINSSKLSVSGIQKLGNSLAPHIAAAVNVDTKNIENMYHAKGMVTVGSTADAVRNNASRVRLPRRLRSGYSEGLPDTTSINGRIRHPFEWNRNEEWLKTTGYNGQQFGPTLIREFNAVLSEDITQPLVMHVSVWPGEYDPWPEDYIDLTTAPPTPLLTLTTIVWLGSVGSVATVAGGVAYLYKGPIIELFKNQGYEQQGDDMGDEQEEDDEDIDHEEASASE